MYIGGYRKHVDKTSYVEEEEEILDHLYHCTWKYQCTRFCVLVLFCTLEEEIG